ncbi:PEP/pyruvate-binding domain-containing protein [Plantactinospora sp. B24E8]|uniref:PEP/pyruvate-binding domain-containing protein n=1 Tax=Plantactinospora sp. B24E8 TaxID=3153567 RepID=UPI00325DE346
MTSDPAHGPAVIRPLRADRPVRRHAWGGKAWNLRRLAEAGIAVPPAVVVPADTAPPTPAELREVLRTLVGGPAVPDRAPLAVRSSVYGEDSAERSLAGSFRTVLGTMTADEAAEAVAEVRRAAGTRPTGVILQRLVDCAFAGVLFSAHPITYDRGRLVLAAVEGRGDRLVDGRVPGEYVELPRTGDLPEGTGTPLTGMRPRIAELRAVGLRVEALWGVPVDLEWAVEAGTGTLWVLQARPVVLPAAAEVELSSVEAIGALPRIVAGHHKLALRRRALRAGVPMSRATAVVGRDPADGRRLWFGSEPGAAGLSVVLLWPERVDNAVVREFATAGPDLDPTVSAVLARGLGTSWLAVCLVQEIHDAPWTGILRRTADGYLVELAQGHFVPKGVVVTSRYVLDRTPRVLSRHCPEQETAYRFVDGHVVREERPIRHLPTDSQLGEAVRQLRPMLTGAEHAVLEFGLLAEGDTVRAYLIDVAEPDRPATPPDVGLLDTGVISAGRARGRLTVAAPDRAEASLDTHLHDRPDRGDEFVDVVFLAERATTDLLPLVYRCGRGSGFVFGTGSVLGHVGVVLRELGIPAVVVGPQRWRELAASGRPRPPGDPAAEPDGTPGPAAEPDGTAGDPATAVVLDVDALTAGVAAVDRATVVAAPVPG